METKGWTIRSFSVNEQDLPFLQKLREAGIREGKSQSEMVVVAVKEYVDRHIPPNPQPTLDRVISVQMPVKPSSQCCVPNCRGKARFRLQLRNFAGKKEVFNICQRHREWRHPVFRFLESWKELP